MAQTLLSNKLQRKLHIALFVLCALFAIQVNAQTVLLPGDVVVVSANADTHSVDLIPLIDIERGTSVYISNGKWNNSENGLEGNELKLTFNAPILAGTNIHINKEDDPRFSKSGALHFEGDKHRLFIFQKEESIYRFIFAMGWGKTEMWNMEGQTPGASDIPLSIAENPNTLLTLGEESNQQYYLRNGASGTKNMLLSLVGNPENWKGNDQHSFDIFGTSFNLLSPPVIQFENSITEVNEGDSTATLNVAIYEHDGSRMSVEVEFDSLRSIASKADLGGFTSKRINFTGLVGDFIYAVEVPILDDEIYEGRETGIFILNKLSAGNYGDFLTQNLIIEDNEKPEIFISRVSNSIDRSGFIEIQNLEEATISMEGWVLSGNKQKYVFPKEAVLSPNETLRWMDASGSADAAQDQKVFASSLRTRMLNSEGGILTLQNLEGKIVHQVSYSRLRNNERRNAERIDLAVQELNQNDNQNAIPQSSAAFRTQNTGWKVLSSEADLSNEFSEKIFYTWNEELQSFETTSQVPVQRNPVFGFFEDGEMEKLNSYISASRSKAVPSEELTLAISATDNNGNGTIEGIEGLNFVINTLDKPISVQSFLENLKSEYPEVSVSNTVYRIRQKASGSLEFIKLEANESIAPKSPFLIMLETEIPAISLSLAGSEIKENISSQSDPAAMNQGLLEFTLRNQSDEEKVQIMVSDDENIERVKDLNSYPELHFPDQSYLNFSFQEGEDFYNELSLFSEIDRQIVLPVHFGSSEGGKITFSVTGWDQIPSDWSISLLDRNREKEYNLGRDFSVTIEHIFPEKINDDPEESMFSENQNRDSDRFAIKINPAKTTVRNEESSNDKPRQVELHQNYPNPFNPVTTISFYLPKSEEVRLSVFNIVGQPVAVIVDGTLSAGQQQFEWDATDKPSGMYIYQLEVGNTVMTRKMTLVK